MNEMFFSEQMARLERNFNRGQTIDPQVKDEYYKVLRLFREKDLIQAVDAVIQTHRPYAGHAFPSLATILDSLNDVMRQRPEATLDDLDGLNICSKCGGGGRSIVLDDGQGQETFCDCRIGERWRKARGEYIEAHGRGYHSPKRQIKQSGVITEDYKAGAAGERWPGDEG